MTLNGEITHILRYFTELSSYRGLSVGVSSSEPCKNGWSDRDAVCVDDSGGPKESAVAYSTTQYAALAWLSFNLLNEVGSLFWYRYFEVRVRYRRKKVHVRYAAPLKISQNC